MTLIKVLDESNFVGIQYPDNTYDSIRGSLIKELYFDDTLDDVVLIEDGGKSISLNLAKVEDPGNPGNPFGTLENLWDYIMGIIS